MKATIKNGTTELVTYEITNENIFISSLTQLTLSLKDYASIIPTVNVPLNIDIFKEDGTALASYEGLKFQSYTYSANDTQIMQNVISFSS